MVTEDAMRMMRTFGRGALGFAAAMLLLVAPARAVDTVTIGTVGSPSANLWPLFIGVEKGFYAAENLKPDLVYIQSSASVIQQLSAGSLDMSMSTGIVDPIRAIDQGAALALTRFEVQVPPYALLAKASIKSLKDLKGKVISVGGPKDITRLYVDRMLAPQGLKSGDYDYVYAGATTARAQALLGGAVDAAVLLPPSNFQIQSQGYNDLGLAMQYAPELAFSGTVVNRAWAGRNPEVLKRALAAQSKSTEYLYDPKNRAEVVGILVKVSGQKPEDVEKSYDFFTKNDFFDRTGKISRVKMNALVEALVGLGDVKAPGNVERFLLPGVAQLSD
jgi:NitT/TauT family transport system substrate-binding protein